MYQQAMTTMISATSTMTPATISPTHHELHEDLPEVADRSAVLCTEIDAELSPVESVYTVCSALMSPPRSPLSIALAVTVPEPLPSFTISTSAIRLRLPAASECTTTRSSDTFSARLNAKRNARSTLLRFTRSATSHIDPDSVTRTTPADGATVV